MGRGSETQKLNKLQLVNRRHVFVFKKDAKSTRGSQQWRLSLPWYTVQLDKAIVALDMFPLAIIFQEDCENWVLFMEVSFV